MVVMLYSVILTFSIMAEGGTLTADWYFPAGRRVPFASDSTADVHMQRTIRRVVEIMLSNLLVYIAVIFKLMMMITDTPMPPYIIGKAFTHTNVEDLIGDHGLRVIFYPTTLPK